MTRVRTLRNARWGVLAALVALLALLLPGTTAHAAAVQLMVSSSPSRSAAVPLGGTTQAGTVYVFTTPTAGVAKVTFWLDDPQRQGVPRQVETWAPFDFRGGSNAANPWDTTSVANGSHSITVQVLDNANVTTIVTATFTVANGTVAGYAPQVSTSSNRSAPVPVAGAVLKGADYVFVPSVPGITKVSFYLDDPARAHAPRHVETSAAWDFSGTGTGSAALPWDTTSVADGSHVISVDVATAKGTTHLDATFTVLNAVGPSPTPTPTPSATTPAPVPSASSGPVPPPAFVTHFTFARIASMPIGTTEADSVVVGGKLYVFGGFDVLAPRQDPTSRAWIYDPATNVWTRLPDMPSHGISHAGIDSDGSRYIYLAGGFAFDPTLQAQLKGTDLVWRYDIVSQTYTAMPSLPQKRASGGLSYINGKIYYFGGSENYMVTPDHGETWSLDVANGATTWVPLASMPNPRNHFGWVTLNGQVYVAGGQHQEASWTATTELDRYDPGSNRWTTLAPMPSPRSHMLDSSFILDGHFVVATGWTLTDKTAAVTAYDPVSNSWQSLTDMPSARTSATGRAVGGGRYVICCGSAGGTSTSDGWIANPAP